MIVFGRKPKLTRQTGTAFKTILSKIPIARNHWNFGSVWLRLMRFVGVNALIHDYSIAKVTMLLPYRCQN
jgi:hypothetical protein